ncbi:hypothetical protein Misp01_08740 [Microtetraspora sp. NBRC 13810]|nr:hypothetical protein Misp01_08740 [Microtetraspora sp. NBRC 13810]
MTLAIATAMAGKAVEIAGEPAKEAIGAMVRKVREKFRGRAAEEALVIAAETDPDSTNRLGALQGALQRVMGEDPAFAGELRALWNQAQVSAAAHGDGVVNVFHGQAEKSIQLRDVHGGLTIN